MIIIANFIKYLKKRSEKRIKRKRAINRLISIKKLNAQSFISKLTEHEYKNLIELYNIRKTVPRSSSHHEYLETEENKRKFNLARSGIDYVVALEHLSNI